MPIPISVRSVSSRASVSPASSRSLPDDQSPTRKGVGARVSTNSTCGAAYGFCSMNG